MTHADIPPRIIPPERQLPFFKALTAMLDNPMEAWPRAIYEEPAWVPPRADFRRIYLCEPAALKRVFLDEVEDFPKSPLAQRLLTPMLGQGLVTASHEDWRWQRRAAAPAFQQAGIDQSVPAIAACAQAAVERWQSEGEKERDMCAEMMAITFNIVLDTLLGGRERVDAVEMGRQFTAYLKYLGKPNFADVIGAPVWMRTAFSADRGHSVAFMRRAVDRIIVERRSAPARGDLIDLLMAGKDHATGLAMNDSQLRDNLLTFLAAGHETTALSLVWSLFLLSGRPEWEAVMLAEIKAHAGEKSIDVEAASKLRATRALIEEAMRLYPPVPVLSRVAKKECTLVGHKVRPGDAVIAPIYALHRHRLYWEQPDAFEPRRFVEPALRRANRYVYLPFGAGPRICLGAAFALTEATIVLATIVRAFSVQLREQHPIRPLLRITMRPEGGLPMRLRIRREKEREDCTRKSAPSMRRTRLPLDADVRSSSDRKMIPRGQIREDCETPLEKT